MLEAHPGKKLAGVLVPVFALRGREDAGIGDTAALVEAIHWAARNRIGLLQILPVNEPGGDHSPYNVLSAMALDPLTIDARPGALPGLEEDDHRRLMEEAGACDPRRVDYARAERLKGALLEAAFARFGTKGRSAFERFAKAHAAWLDDYALHRALIERNGTEAIASWPPEHANPDAARAWVEGLPPAERRRFQRRVRFRKFVQWVAYSQWESVRREADAAGVALMGDVPVGVSISSADVWSRPEIFDVRRSCGAPPERVFRADPFTERWGQNWGFPLYNWERMSRDNFAWWRRRLRLLMRLFHLVRVDHALGFFRIYSFPWRPEENAAFLELTREEAAARTGGELPRFMDRGDDTPEDREHNRQRGAMLLRIFLEETGPHHLIAEDLGEVPPYVRPTLAELEIPGFKIPQWERTDGALTPGADYPRLSLATFATHDHPPLRALWEEANNPEGATLQRELLAFCGRRDIAVPSPFNEEIHRAMLKAILDTNSWLAVHMITDLFGTADRFNVPGSASSNNWTTRVAATISDWDRVHADVLGWFREAVAASGRAP